MLKTSAPEQTVQDSVSLRPKQKQRIVALDAARGAAICLALFSHFLYAFHGMQLFTAPYGSIVRAITSTATPTFILLFGSLLEIIYVPRYRSWGASQTRSRLWQRALICFGVYYLCILIFFLLGLVPSKELLAGILMMTGGQHSGVYSFYAVLLLIAPFIIWVRLHWGFSAVVLISVVTYLIGSAVPDVQLQDYLFRLNYYTCVLFGKPTNHYYPFSIFHMMVLVAVGMYLGRLMLRLSSKDAAIRMLTAGVLILILYLILAYLFEPDRAFPYIRNMNLFRLNQHPFYFLFVIPNAFFLTAFFLWFLPKESDQSPNRFRWVQLVGKRSLFVFFLGNLILLLSQQFLPKLGVTSIIFQLTIVGIMLLFALKVYLIWAEKKEVKTETT